MNGPRLRIGFMTHEYPPFFGGGIGTYVEQISRAFAQSGHEVHIFTIRRPDDPTTIDASGVHVHRAPFDPPEPLARGLIGRFAEAGTWIHLASIMRRQLREFLQRGELDIVEIPECLATGWMALGDPALRVPTVVNLHTPDYVVAALNHSDTPAWKHLERLPIEAADGVCAPSRAMIDHLADDVHRGDVEVVPHPYDADGFIQGYTPPIGDEILFVGRLEHRKGVVTLIQAAKAMLALDANVVFTLIGRDTNTAPGGGSMRDYLQGLLTDHERRRVRFLDAIPRHELAESYRRASFCVFPSLFENFPNVCLEAMSAGRPVIATYGTGMVEMLGETGVFVEPDDPADLAEAMLRLRRNHRLRDTLAALTYLRVRDRYTPARAAQWRLEYYRRVIDQCGGVSDLAQRTARVHPQTWRTAAPSLAALIHSMHANSAAGSPSTSEATP
ncbi:MAG: glycosyltransferase family 4 protein [Deltaproteobacteria bacterium]|nr:glycosyltransferase family 4 protein [Deltaproteobacteria bacterium]